ncbi:MAG: hypothetical protein QOJ71_492 [Actinomycetota bacterium]|nr:hypothetical protein [Actinomycetota bacterium]
MLNGVRTGGGCSRRYLWRGVPAVVVALVMALVAPGDLCFGAATGGRVVVVAGATVVFEVPVVVVGRTVVVVAAVTTVVGTGLRTCLLPLQAANAMHPARPTKVSGRSNRARSTRTECPVSMGRR